MHLFLLFEINSLIIQVNMLKY